MLVERLRDGGHPRRAVYVRAGEEAHLHHVAVGGYVLQFLSGTDWDDPVRRFHYQAEGHVFAASLKFTEAAASAAVAVSPSIQSRCTRWWAETRDRRAFDQRWCALTISFALIESFVR